MGFYYDSINSKGGECWTWCWHSCQRRPIWSILDIVYVVGIDGKGINMVNENSINVYVFISVS
jgi:hypothetical protein